MKQERIRKVFIYAAAAIFLWYLGVHYVRVTFRHRNDIPIARTTVRAIKRISTGDVGCVIIMLGNERRITLLPPADRSDINRIISSLKRVTVADRERGPAAVDRIIVDGEKGGVNLYCNLDPDRAPILSPALRSDDLAKVVSDVLRRRGLILQKG